MSCSVDAVGGGGAGSIQQARPSATACCSRSKDESRSRSRARTRRARLSSSLMPGRRRTVNEVVPRGSLRGSAGILAPLRLAGPARAEVALDGLHHGAVDAAVLLPGQLAQLLHHPWLEPDRDREVLFRLAHALS